MLYPQVMQSLCIQIFPCQGSVCDYVQDLDELQSYVLLRRWLQDEGEILTGDGLTHRQRSMIQAAYFAERNFIYSCLGCLLQAKEGEDDSATQIRTKRLITPKSC